MPPMISDNITIYFRFIYYVPLFVHEWTVSVSRFSPAKMMRGFNVKKMACTA